MRAVVGSSAERGPLRWAQCLFFALLVRPLALLVLGINVRNRERLPRHGPAIIAANHNSHLDALVLMALVPLRDLHRVRPVAAADYFLRNRLLAWFVLRVVGILPLQRGSSRGGDPLAGLQSALERGDILLLFPEGSRGEPETPAPLKPGVAHLLQRVPHAVVVPVRLAGLGKALPRGEGILVPFICDIHVGRAIQWRGERRQVMDALNEWLGSGTTPEI